MMQVVNSSSLVSVVICTHDRAEYLDRCLASIFAQQYRNFEVIVAYDVSTDDTEKVLAKYPVKVLRQETLVGPSKARNLGIAAARGDILAFLDDDSTAAADWLKVIVSRFKSEPDIQCLGGKVITTATGKVEFLYGTIDMFARSRPVNAAPAEKAGKVFNNVIGTNFAVRSKAMRDIGCFDEYYAYFYEESDVAVRIALAGGRVDHEPAAIVWHAHAPGPYRSSKWDQNWYIITRNTVYFSLKNFGRQMGWLNRTYRPIRAYAGKVLSFVVPFLRGEIPVPLMLKIYGKVTRGFLDGRRDGNLRVRKSG